MSTAFPGNGVCGNSIPLTRLAYDQLGRHRIEWAIERTFTRRGKEYWQFRCPYCRGLNTWPKSLILHRWGGDRRDCHLPEPSVEEMVQMQPLEEGACGT